MSHNQSKYFEFKSELVNNNFSLSEFKGWNGLIIMKLDCPKDLNIKNDLINSKYIDISEKEKIIVAIKGEVEVKLNHQSFVLKEFDSLNLYSSDSKFENAVHICIASLISFCEYPMHENTSNMYINFFISG